jgi:hypothetical protein
MEIESGGHMAKQPRKTIKIYVARRLYSHDWRSRGWICPEEDFGDAVRDLVKTSFDDFYTDLRESGGCVQDALAAFLKSYRERLTGHITRQVGKWQPAPRRIGVSAGSAIDAVAATTKELFHALHSHITHYNLIDPSDPAQKIVAAHLISLEERVVDRATTMVEGWK